LACSLCILCADEARKEGSKKAYVPMLARERGDLKAAMDPMEQFKREMFLLYHHPQALTEITKGIRGDQQIIAQTLQNNQLMVRIL